MCGGPRLSRIFPRFCIKAPNGGLVRLLARRKPQALMGFPWFRGLIQPAGRVCPKTRDGIPRSVV